MNTVKLRIPRLKTKQAIIAIVFLAGFISISYLIRHRLENTEATVWPLNPGPSFSNTELRTLFTVQEHYKSKLSSLTPDDLQRLSEQYYRKVNLHWGNNHGLFPASKPLPHPSCLRHLDQQVSTPITVVLCMKNELIYLLLRTLTTIVKRTPPHLLQEIVLIDDGSDHDDSDEISQFCSKMRIPLKQFRNSESVGVANCRYQGIERASAEVVVVLDSHMEVADLWLEPLLEILHDKPQAVAIPTIDNIKEDEYNNKHLRVLDAYGIEMMSGYSYFRYYHIGPPSHDQSAPYKTASDLGGALAAHRSTFLYLYPRGVLGEYWGTENSRLAHRAWACGDGLWMTRCSQILHVNGNDGELVRYRRPNSDMWKNLHYETLGDVVNLISGDDEKLRMLHSVYRQDVHIQRVLNVSHAIREQFDSSSCAYDFKWYLENLQPSHSLNYIRLSSAEYIIAGEAKSVSHPTYCIASDFSKIYIEKSCRGKNTLLYDTHLLGFSVKGEIHTPVQTLNCWDVGPGRRNETEIMPYSCHTTAHPELNRTFSTQFFKYDEQTQQIKHVESERCVQIYPDRGTVLLVYCKNDVREQKWIITNPRWR